LLCPPPPAGRLKFSHISGRSSSASSPDGTGTTSRNAPVSLASAGAAVGSAPPPAVRAAAADAISGGRAAGGAPASPAAAGVGSAERDPGDDGYLTGRRRHLTRRRD